jgi:hypothetical protein
MKLFTLSTLVTALACIQISSADPGYVSTGLKFQKTHRLYWENGLEAGYTHDVLLDRKVQLGLSYVSSRFGSALVSRALNQDYLAGFVSFHFRPDKIFDPYAQLNCGYFRHERGDIVKHFKFENEADRKTFIDNSSGLLDLVLGAKFNVLRKIGGLYADLGYRFWQDSNMLYPFFFSLGFSVNLFPGIAP